MRMLLVLLFILLPGTAFAEAGKPVDVAIVVSYDRSESIDREEASAQITGLIYTLRHPRFHAVISGGYYKRIALSVLAWSSFARHELILPWMQIGTAEQAWTAALWLEKFLSRPDQIKHGKQTDVAYGIKMAAEQMHALPWQASKLVINMVGDGISNIGRVASIARDEALASHITVNGLIMAQGDGVRVLSRYYRNEVIGGPTSFLQLSINNRDFAEAMLRKMTFEMARLRSPGHGHNMAVHSSPAEGLEKGG